MNQARHSPEVENTRRAHVLVVDDVEANLLAMESVLDGLQCSVVAVRSGEEALRHLLREDFAVILLDVQMPGMDGYEVARYARRHPVARDVPIIFLTAAHDSVRAHEMRGYDSGAVDFLFKPIEPNILRGKVRVFIELAAVRGALSDLNACLCQRNEQLGQLADARAMLAEEFRIANEELSRTNRELKEAQAHLVQSAKMASLGTLVAGIAHEINNPLAFVTSHLSTVRRALSEVRAHLGPHLPEEIREQWARVDDRMCGMHLGLTRIRDLVVKLRTFSRLDEGERKSVQVSECLDSVLTILGHRLGHRVRVSVACGEPAVVECFPGLLNQALMNLLSNAVDAIAGAGTVTITTGLDDDGSYAFRIADSGSGIPAAIRERVVEPFFTTKPAGEGTGLGLSITYNIVKQHGGSLELRNAAAGGTVATIRIPVRAREHADRGR